MAALLGAAGCGGGSRTAEPPVAALRNTDLPESVRRDAVAAARKEAGSDPRAAAAARQALKDIVWTPTQPAALRVDAMRSLLNDYTDEASQQDARELGKLILPREQSREMVILLGQTAADRGWRDYVPSLVRAYARPSLRGVKEEERAERIALAQIRPGVPIEDVVLEEFLNPPAAPPSYGLDWAQRTRNDAWEVLSRIDKDGVVRRRALERADGARPDPCIDAIRACIADLRAMPLTGDQLAWAMALVGDTSPAGREWWARAKAAIAQAPADALELRHAEAIRWAAANRPSWYRASRDDLLSELRARLDTRTRTERSAESSADRVPERLARWEKDLGWADLLTVLVVDDALRDPGVVAAMFRQIDLDRKDTTTEYGGLLTFGTGAGVPAAVLYPPRPGQRRGDDQFVASDDMIASGGRSIAHYHFHVQHRRAAEYAGPSPADLDYARRYGRSCVVLTALGDGVLGVDFYQPDGVVLDLGEVRAGK